MLRNGNKVNDRSTKKLKWRSFLFISIVGVCIVAGLAFLSNVLSTSNASSTYCTSIDPTDCKISVSLLNDTDTSVLAKQCDELSAPCKSFISEYAIPPAQSHSVEGSTDGTPQVWIILNQKSHVIGCLNLAFTKDTVAPVSAQVSKMLRCSDVDEAIHEFKQQYHLN